MLKSLLNLLATDLTVALAILLVLAGSFLLPDTQAATSSIVQIEAQVTCTEIGQICAEAGEEEPAPSPGSGGGSYIPPATLPPTVPPTEEPIVVPPVPVKPPTPPSGFLLYDVAPKILFANKPVQLILYGVNFPESFQINVKSETGQYSIQARNLGTHAVTGSTVRFIQNLPPDVLPLGDAVLWMSDNGQDLSGKLPVYVHEKVAALGLAAQPTTVTRLIEMAPGSRTKVTVTFRNTGAEMNQFMKPLMVGTRKPYDRSSLLFDGTWPYGNRPTLIDLDKPIQPGQSFSADVWLKAPNVTRTTTYTESFGLVAEGLTWIPRSDFTLWIKVVPPKQGATASRPATPRKSFLENVVDFITPGPAAAQPTEPKSPYVTAKPRLTIPFLSNIWNAITRLFR